MIEELGKPLNISEGFNGRGTLIVASGLSFPIDHIKRLGELAIKGQEERQRNIEAVVAQSLPMLNFSTVKRPAKRSISEKKLSGCEALLAMRTKRNK